LRPSIVYDAMSSGTRRAVRAQPLCAASRTMRAICAWVSGSKYTAAQRERIAASIASGSRVVAPISTKSAGAPSRKSFFT
jgi:hypothetical protein